MSFLFETYQYVTNENILLIGFDSEATYKNMLSKKYSVLYRLVQTVYSNGDYYTILGYDPYNKIYIYSFKSLYTDVGSIKDNYLIGGGGQTYIPTEYVLPDYLESKTLHLSTTNYQKKIINQNEIFESTFSLFGVNYIQKENVQLINKDTNVSYNGIYNFLAYWESFRTNFSFKILDTVPPGRYKVRALDINFDTLYNIILAKPVITIITSSFVELKPGETATITVRVTNYNIIDTANFLILDYGDKILNINNAVTVIDPDIKPYITYDKNTKEMTFTLNSEFNKKDGGPDILLSYSNGFDVSDSVVLKNIPQDLNVPVLLSIAPVFPATGNPYIFGQKFIVTGSNLGSEALRVSLRFIYGGGNAGDCPFLRIGNKLEVTIPNTLSLDPADPSYYLRLINNAGMSQEQPPIVVKIFKYIIKVDSVTPNKVSYNYKEVITIKGQDFKIIKKMNLSKDDKKYDVDFIYYFTDDKLEFYLPKTITDQTTNLDNLFGTYSIYFNDTVLSAETLTLESDKVTTIETYSTSSKERTATTVQGGYTIVVEGEGYTDLSYLELQSNSDPTITIRVEKDKIYIFNNGQVMFNLPFDIIPGDYNIFLYNTQGKVNANVNNKITVIETEQITSVSVNPSTVPPSYAEYLILNGDNYETVQSMYMKLKNSTIQISITDYVASLANTEMEFLLPQNLQEGEYDIFLVNDAGTTQFSQLTITGNTPTPICFKEDTKIVCLQDNIETDIFIQNLKSGDLVKTYKHGYLPVNVVGRNICYNPKNAQRLKSRLFKLKKEKYPSLKEDLIVTGCHSILVRDTEMSQSKGEELIRVNKRVYTTDGFIRLPAYLDDRSDPYLDECGDINVYHVALGNDESRNYGIYANGLLVESCFIPRIKNEMTIIS